jgi:hypothetical protein
MTKPSLFKRLVRILAVLIALTIIAYGLLIVFVQPRNDRQWTADQTHLPKATFEQDTVRIENVRNVFYRSTTDYDARWELRSYDLTQIDSVWFMVEPFEDWRGPAHTLLSFGFRDGRYVAISVELRKEIGEQFSPIKGALRQYELMYVIGDERDLIGLRANHRKDDVYLYKMRATPEQARELFVSMLQRANQLAEQPEFYNTFTQNCTSTIVDHVESMYPDRIPWSYKIMLPGYSDELAYDIGLIDTQASREDFRAQHQINVLAAKHADQEDFSLAIRGISPAAASHASPSR